MLHNLEIVKMLGEGGMAVIYLVKDEMGKLMVMKKIKTTVIKKYRPIYLAALEKESKILHVMNSVQGVPVIYDLSDSKPEDENDYLLMEYITGISLDVLLKKKKSVKDTLLIQWLLQICEIIANLQERGFLHLDIKPQNMMLNERNDVMLIDYGTCRKIGVQEEQEFAITPRLWSTRAIKKA